MNKSHKRLTRATLAIGSFVAIVVVGVPWVDEYRQRRRDASELVELKTEVEQASLRDRRLSAIATNLVESLQNLQTRSIQQSEVAEVRDKLTELVRKAGARLRHIDASAGLTRPWGLMDDDIRSTNIPESGQESDFLLTTVMIDLRAAGPIESIIKILEDIAGQGWLVTTSSLVINPAESKGSDIALEIRLIAYGLELETKTPLDEIAATSTMSSGRL